MSSGETKSRPESNALARPSFRSAREPLGLAPTSSWASSRVARTTATAYLCSSGATWTSSTLAWMALNSSAVTTGAMGTSSMRRSARRVRIPTSSSSDGYPTLVERRKRSSWASGRGYVPSDSMGFWVAITRKGDGNPRVVPSAVTCRSCMASRSAAWVLAGARFTSSARTSWANTGPRRKTGSFVARSSTVAPVMSAGRMSRAPRRFPL